MKRLRLIKPWNLRAVRQRLDNTCDISGPVKMASFNAPHSDEDDVYMPSGREICRVQIIHHTITGFNNNTPRSDVFYISLPAKSIR